MARCVLFPHYLIYKEQIKGLEFISSVLFAFGICCCQLSIWDPKSCPLSVKQAIIRLKKSKQNRSEGAQKTLGVAKSTVLETFLKRKWAQQTPKDPEDHGKTTVVDDRRNSFPGEEKTPSQQLGQIKKHSHCFRTHWAVLHSADGK